MHIISIEIERATAERLLRQITQFLEEQPGPDLAELIMALAEGLDEFAVCTVCGTKHPNE